MTSKYEEFKSQYKISNRDFEVQYRDNILSQLEITQLYDLINKTEDKIKIMEWGVKAWQVELPNNIKDKVATIVSEMVGEEVETYELSFLRYETDSSYVTKLFPHYDSKPHQRNNEHQTLTLDIQMDANIKWGVIVENSTYYLENNQAILFSGSQQQHWREKIDIMPGDKVDVLVCHLFHKNRKPLDPDHEHIMDMGSNILMEEVGINGAKQTYGK